MKKSQWILFPQPGRDRTWLGYHPQTEPSTFVPQHRPTRMVCTRAGLGGRDGHRSKANTETTVTQQRQRRPRPTQIRRKQALWQAHHDWQYQSRRHCHPGTTMSLPCKPRHAGVYSVLVPLYQKASKFERFRQVHVGFQQALALHYQKAIVLKFSKRGRTSFTKALITPRARASQQDLCGYHAGDRGEVLETTSARVQNQRPRLGP